MCQGHGVTRVKGLIRRGESAAAQRQGSGLISPDPRAGWTGFLRFPTFAGRALRMEAPMRLPVSPARSHKDGNLRIACGGARSAILWFPASLFLQKTMQSFCALPRSIARCDGV
jgi:hypothetical protein